MYSYFCIDKIQDICFKLNVSKKAEKTMSDESLNEITKEDLQVEAKLIISTTSGNKIKLLLSRNLRGELDFLSRHFKVPRTKKTDKEIENRLERITGEYINAKKNKIVNIDTKRLNKGDLRKFVLDCFITVENDKSNSSKNEKFSSLDEITKTSERKSLALLNTLVYFTEKKNKL